MNSTCQLILPTPAKISMYLMCITCHGGETGRPTTNNTTEPVKLPWLYTNLTNCSVNQFYQMLPFSHAFRLHCLFWENYTEAYSTGYTLTPLKYPLNSTLAGTSWTHPVIDFTCCYVSLYLGCITWSRDVTGKLETLKILNIHLSNPQITRRDINHNKLAMGVMRKS